MALPSSARSRVRGESRSSPWKTTQVSPVARMTPDRMPSLASLSTVPVKASEAMSSETVNPMPPPSPPHDRAPADRGRQPPRVSLLTSHAAPAVPTGLPTTYPIMMPSVAAEVYACARNDAPILMSALASANSGTMM